MRVQIGSNLDVRSETCSEVQQNLPDFLEAPDLLRAIIATTPECIKIVGPDGALLHMNLAGLKMVEATGWESVRGASTLDLIAPEHRANWQRQHRRVCDGENLTWEFDIIGLAGTRRHMETHAVPIRLDNGTVGQLAITRDITDRVDAQGSLQSVNEDLEYRVARRTRELEDAVLRLEESERGFALLVDSVTDYAIFMLERDGKVASWNSGAQRIKGYAAEEIIGRHFSCFYTEEDRNAGMPMRGLEVAANEGRIEMEGWRVRKDGSRFIASVIIDAIRKGNELVGFAKITRDITEKRAAETQLRQAQKLEAIGQLTGGVAHDFNNLLMAIGGSLELLRKRLPDDQRLRSLLDNARQGVTRGVSLTQRMLAFARRQELKQEAVDLGSLIAGMTEMLQRTLGPAIELETYVPRQLSSVYSDANQLETALINLVLNGRDAMPAGGTIRIDARAETVDARHPTQLKAGQYVCISVGDDGGGMDEATLARVTEPFFTTKGVGKGTGLGLSMVDGLVAQSNGKMIIHSEPGKGTTVELWLPAAEAGATKQQATNRDLEPNIDVVNGRLAILVVDDDPLVLSNMADMLEDLGHNVIAVASGTKALATVETSPAFDIVITDQLMPGMTGLQLAEAIHARHPGPPVILATAFGEFPVGASSKITRLQKPFDQRQLAASIAAVVHKAIT